MIDFDLPPDTDEDSVLPPCDTALSCHPSPGIWFDSSRRPLSLSLDFFPLSPPIRSPPVPPDPPGFLVPFSSSSSFHFCRYVPFSLRALSSDAVPLRPRLLFFFTTRIKAIRCTLYEANVSPSCFHVSFSISKGMFPD